jgi:tRNA threonylcarbamoyladenosine biosynthesis protein TsaB
MRVLAFDTSTEWCSVAVGDGAQWHSHDERAGQSHSERLLPMVRAVLAEVGWGLSDLDGIAFGTGPGSFTGVRIGCGVAQGLALGADLPVVPVPTLAAIAAASGRARVLACLDARMREVYVAAYMQGHGVWSEVAAPAVMAPAAVTLPGEGGWFGAGGGYAAYPDLGPRLGLVAVDPSIRPAAAAIGEIALPRFLVGDGVAAADVLPLYVRHRVALTAAERAAGAVL